MRASLQVDLAADGAWQPPSSPTHDGGDAGDERGDDVCDDDEDDFGGWEGANVSTFEPTVVEAGRVGEAGDEGSGDGSEDAFGAFAGFESGLAGK